MIRHTFAHYCNLQSVLKPMCQPLAFVLLSFPIWDCNIQHQILVQTLQLVYMYF